MENKTIEIKNYYLSASTSRIELIIAYIYAIYKNVLKITNHVLLEEVAPKKIDFNVRVVLDSAFEDISSSLDVIFNRTGVEKSIGEKLVKFHTLFRIESNFKKIAELCPDYMGINLSEMTVSIPKFDTYRYTEAVDEMLITTLIKPHFKEVVTTAPILTTVN